MGQLLALPVNLISVDCGSCGGTYAINQRHHSWCKENGKSWTCPYCKTGWGFVGNGELENARKELALERQRNDAALSRANKAEAAAAKAERARKKIVAAQKKDHVRIANGVCPCCNRTFVNLQRHMTTKHPEFAADGS